VVTDAAIIGNQAGTTLILARYDQSPDLQHGKKARH
jgi:hypothetical protein